jgi:hypothetical protein
VGGNTFYRRFIVQVLHGIGGPPEFECASPLLIFAFEIKLSTKHFIKGLTDNDWCASDEW